MKNPNNRPLGPAWVHQGPRRLPGYPDTQPPFDRRREAATHHPFERVLEYWCQEDYKGKRCNTFLGAVYATSEGLLWEAWIKEPIFEMFIREGGDKKIPEELQPSIAWLDDGEGPLSARCRRHGWMMLERTAAANAVKSGMKQARLLDDWVTFR